MLAPRLLAIAVLAAAALAAGASTASAAPSLLFVQQASGGTLTTSGSAYRLTLRGVTSVASFTDRPTRDAGSELAATFVRRWKARGFSADPPNAALVLDGAPRGRDLAILTLSRPRYSRRTRTLTFTARPLKGRAGGALAAFEARRDPIRVQRFGAASLFVDNASALVFQPIALQVSNAMPGQTVSVAVAPNGPDVGLSSGPSLQNSSTLSIVSQSGPLPLTQATLTPQSVVVQTSANVGAFSALSFSIRAYLVAEQGAETFYLRSASDPGIEVTAQLGDAAAVIVNQTQTLFAWDPV